MTYFSYLLLFCSMTSCISYQYATIESADLRKTETGELMLENDTLAVYYRFRGANCPATVRIYNKLSVPLYVDWARSSFIVDGKSVSHVPNTLAVDATATGTTFDWTRNLSTTNQNITGTVRTSPAVGFIPPASYLEGQEVVLWSSFFDMTGAGGRRVERKGYFLRVKSREFDESESPLVFRNYLTVSTAADGSNPVFFDSSFWVAEVISSSAGPNSFLQQGHDNYFYLARPNGMGAFMGVMALTASVVAVGMAQE